MKIVFVLALMFMIGCSDTQMASLSAIGNPAHVVCYSGATAIIDTMSTGKVATVNGSDGWEFKDSKTGKFTRVSGPCVIVN